MAVMEKSVEILDAKMINQTRIKKSQVQLEHRIFLTLLLMGIFISLLSGIANILQQTPAARILAPFVVAVMLAFIFWYCIQSGRFNGPMVAVSFLVCLFILPYLWAAHGGLAGGFPYFVPYFGVVLLAVHRGLRRWLFLTLLITMTAAMVLMDVSKSDWIDSISEPYLIQYSNLFGLAGSTLCILVLFQIFSRSFVAERKRVEKMARALSVANEELSFMAHQDMLTGISNRRDAVEKMKYLLKLSLRNRKPFCLILVDVDHFKKINDQYGHDCGDYILKALASKLEELKREQDTAARWGGEEFLMILPETDMKGGLVLAERLREIIDSERFYYYGTYHHISITAGVTAFDHLSHDIDDYIRKADIALYWGKENGRNQVNAYHSRMVT